MPRQGQATERPNRATLPSAAEEIRLLQAGYTNIAGIDEAGRGCLAGPVVAAAVVLKPEAYGLVGCMVDVRDSKFLSSTARERVFHEIERFASAIGLGIVPNDFIDRYGIVEATRQAMAMAVADLALRPDHLLIDYLSLPALSLPQKPITYGDTLCVSIAAASIIAKVTRDRLMQKQDLAFPGYGFANNKGYGTPEHLVALQRLGPCAIHRLSFAPVRACAASQTGR